MSLVCNLEWRGSGSFRLQELVVDFHRTSLGHWDKSDGTAWMNKKSKTGFLHIPH